MVEPIIGAGQAGVLAGKLALVTGGTRGIGKGIVLSMAAAGAHVIVTGRDEAVARGVADEVLKAGGRAGFLAADLGEDEAVDALISRVNEQFGILDILVNNAGIDADNPALAHPLEDWRRVIRMNLEVPFRLAKAVAPQMLEKGKGAVINISSILGLVGTREAASYVASKHGLIGLTRALSMEWAGQGIRVNAVAPGLIQTDMTKYIWSAPEAGGYINDRIPAQRIGQPSDIGGAVVFLASDAADFVHGETLAVDGGFLAT